MRKLPGRAGAVGVLAGLALVHMTCGPVLLTAPADSDIFLAANPEFIPSHGGVSVITAFLLEPTGAPVPDGTVVQFFTTLGRIDEQGRTRDGAARVNLVSDSRSGLAEVSAFSGPVSATLETAGGGVVIGNRNVSAILLRAVPPRITGSNSTHVIATVVDERGNPVANVPVFFRVVADPSTEFFDVQGPVFTNQNGEAENVMRTRATLAHVALVSAVAAGGATGTVTSRTDLEIPIL